MGAFPIDSDLRFVALALGYYHGCGLTADGAAHCWGLNDRGQLGDGGTVTRPRVAPVAGDLVFESLAAGGRSTCGITVDDALFCWGQGFFLLDGSLAEASATPAVVAPRRDFDQVATSGFHSSGHTSTGSTYCWGINRYGEPGVETIDAMCGSTPCTAEPQEVVSAPPFVELAVGGAAPRAGSRPTASRTAGEERPRAVGGRHTHEPLRAAARDGGRHLLAARVR